jgi:hypothetical protein
MRERTRRNRLVIVFVTLCVLFVALAMTSLVFGAAAASLSYGCAALTAGILAWTLKR